jgi:hypothetical protein
VGEFAAAGAVLLVVVTVLVIVGTVRRPTPGAPDTSQAWQVCTEARRGVTTVSLRRGSHVIVVREIQDASPTWQDDLIAARAEAAERLATLESEL